MSPFPSEKVVHHGPTVTYDASLNSWNVPYSVRVDEKRCVELLREIGVNKKEIDRLQIHIVRKSKEIPLAVSYFDQAQHIIGICSDVIWKDYVEYSLRVNKLRKGQVKNTSRQFDGFLYTKKLEKYLQTNPSDRALKFAQELLGKAINREASSTFIHESKHVSDAQILKWTSLANAYIVMNFLTGFIISLGVDVMIFKNPFPWQLIPSSVSGLFAATIGAPLLYLINPFERRASKAGKDYENDPRFRDIIIITPKEQ